MQEARSKLQGAGHKSQGAEFISRWALVVLWMGVIFFFSSQPQSALNFGQPAFVGKLAHVTEYAILGWLIVRARGDRRAWWRAWLMAVVYSLTDEFHQSFVPGRHPLVTDVMIDSLGTAIGLATSTFLPRSLPIPRHPQ
jgi:VanZ family protein